MIMGVSTSFQTVIGFIVGFHIDRFKGNLSDKI